MAGILSSAGGSEWGIMIFPKNVPYVTNARIFPGLQKS
jgi:hypothetical protein